jgi:hypothetical protein
MLLGTGGGFGNLTCTLWFALLCGSFAFLDAHSFFIHFVPCIPPVLFWVLWFLFMIGRVSSSF